MTEDEYLLQLARLLTRREDLSTSTVRTPLLELALRIRQLILSLPRDGQLLRTLRYNQLRPQILALLQDFTTRYFLTIRGELPPLDTALRKLIATYLQLPEPLPSLPLTALLAAANVLNRPASQLLAPGPTGLSPFTLQLERLLDTTVRAAILRDAPTDEIANLITPTARRIRKGTTANAWLERTTATTSALYWSLVNPTLTEAAATIPDRPTALWRWNAVLDPRTCPICRPLHNTTAPSPDAFPNGAPPLHPLCRCVTVLV